VDQLKGQATLREYGMVKKSLLCIFMVVLLAAGCTQPSVETPTSGPTEIPLPKDTPTPTTPPASQDELYQGIMIDAHAHFKSKVVNIDKLIIFLDQANINKVVLFADATTLRDVYSKYPDRIIPFLNPFKRDSSTRKLIIPEDAPVTIEEHLESGLFKGIGEITLRLHPLPGVAPEGDNHPADSPVMLEIYDIAAKYGVPVNVHVDLEYIDELERALEHNRKTTIIWAHCGYGDPSLIREMMDRHSNLFADLSIILDPSKGKYSLLHSNPDGLISKEWEKLLEDYSDRLMFGTDMGMSKERYESTSEVTDYYRGLLYQLSPEAAENIAYKTILRIMETTDDGTIEAGLSDCDFVLTASPLDIDSIRYISPLGNLNPPSHVFPTNHIYFYITRQEGADRSDIATLYSPGDLPITAIRASEHVNAGFTDYSLTLQPCPEITVVFGHISSLTEEIFGDTSSFTDWNLGSEYTTSGETYRTWRRECNIEVKAGDILGTTGGNPGQWALDLGVYDQRRLPEMVANPQRWYSTYLHTVCPLSFFEEAPVIDQLWKLVQRDEEEGDSTPCGSVLQDVPGTAQGCWFLSGINATYPEDLHLALVRSNIHPSHAVLSVGNSILNLSSKAYEFLPRDSGLLNRDFQDIVPDGQIYGFEVNQFDGIIVLQMPDGVTLWVEALKDATHDQTSWKFTKNKTEYKR